MLWRLVLIIGWLVACVSPPGPSAPSSAPRWISLSPAVTETLGALGATDQVVARSDFCTLPVQIRSLPTAGSALTPRLEVVASLRPTAVLVDGSEGVPRDALAQVAPVHVLPWLTADDVLSSVGELGRLTGRQQAADALASRLRTGLAARTRPDAPRTLLVLGTDGPAGSIWFIKPDSLHGAALMAAGGANAVAAPVAGAPSLSVERVLALDPDRIVMLEARALTPAERAAAIERWATVEPLRAVRDGQVHVVAQPDLLSTGPGILDFVQRLGTVVAP